jgi:hypothetical protein
MGEKRDVVNVRALLRRVGEPICELERQEADPQLVLQRWPRPRSLASESEAITSATRI